MKSIKNIFFVALGVLACSCNDLDVKPRDIIGDDVVLETDKGVQAYLASIYYRLPIEDFFYNNASGWDDYNPWTVYKSLNGGYVCELDNQSVSTSTGGAGYWPYTYIRDVNYFLEYLEAHKDVYRPDDYKNYVAEAHFLRAFMYFGMAKRYGGVPIITKVQDPTAPVETLQVPRNKEVEVWNFIKDELKLAYELPENTPRGRANRDAAYALMSRAMLYAGSIAKYTEGAELSHQATGGDPLQQGLVGMSPSEANGFFQEAYDAANKIIESKRYQLYRVDPDKTKNFQNVFLDRNSKENIFVRDYSYLNGHGHDQNLNTVPKYVMGGGSDGSYSFPAMNLIELYQELPIRNADGTPRRFSTQGEMYNNDDIEPRLKATVYFPGEYLYGREFDVQDALYKEFHGAAAPEEIDEVTDRPNYKYLVETTDIRELYPATGDNQHAIIGQARETTTGFYRKKYYDPTKDASKIDLGSDETPWIEFRLAEIMLNRAEAAFELGDGEKIKKAKADIQDIRDRAGAKLVSDDAIDLNFVRMERRRELALESHTFWDLRRWRTAHIELNTEKKLYGLNTFYVYDEGKYIFLRQRVGGYHYFHKRAYYNGLPGGEFQKNPNLYPNNPEY